jgi:hypothetical protein
MTERLCTSCGCLFRPSWLRRRVRLCPGRSAREPGAAWAREAREAADDVAAVRAAEAMLRGAHRTRQQP